MQINDRGVVRRYSKPRDSKIPADWLDEWKLQVETDADVPDSHLCSDQDELQGPLSMWSPQTTYHLWWIIL